ncbi:hypothetical protein JD81_00237 [Micromonospora sagamiensis]|uniref:WxL domain-containing protein n=1 Tax=Micromonospora sagamiensis TaxID=47875 RepID=A0A562WAT8_9ACTN|nr:hypothetical protein JD81_00237 [Micromonospora sagamiensis]
MGLLLGVGPVPAVDGQAWGRATLATAPTVQADGLSITVPASISLGAGTPGGTVTGSLPRVTVEDFRSAVNPNAWTATASATAFVTGPGGPDRTVAPSQVAYWSGPVVRSTGGGTLLPGQPTAAQAVTLGAPRVAFRKTTGNANNTVRWSPTLRVTIPSGAVAGTYVATITHSVA